jgi:uncharacterized protein YegL
MRRLPIFLMLDVSESMIGDNLRQLQQGLERLVSKLRTDPHALETVFLSTIVFAGKPKTLTPLTELVFFYPPRLPVGSGTSLGAGLTHLMDEIDRSVVKSTMEKKGDWKPVVYLMTDGKPTDDVTKAIERWKADYATKVTLVAIGIGHHAALGTLRQLTDNVLQLDTNSEEDFKRFVDWVTMSVVAQSRSVAMSKTEGVNLAKLDDSIMKKIGDIVDAGIVDEDIVVLTGKCSNNKLPYLIKYERIPNQIKVEGHSFQVDRFNLTGVYPLEKDYYDLSDHRALVSTVNSDALLGSPGCPHCGNPIGFAVCRCGQIMCLKGAGAATCPACSNEGNFGYSDDGDGFDVNRSRG